MRHMRLYRGAAMLAITAIISFPLMAAAAEFAGISARPANPATSDARTEAWFIYALAPGQVKSDALVVANETDKTQTLDLYPADSAPATGNGFALKQKAEAMTGVGSWVKLERKSLTLAPHGSATIPFAVTVPAGQGAGLWTGGIIVAPAEAARQGQGISIATRVGVRMYVTVQDAVSAAHGLVQRGNRILLALPYAGFALLLAAAVLLYWRILRRRARSIKTR